MSSSSVLSTACSSPHINSVESVIKNDQARYARKGYGLYVSILITVFFFGVIPRVLQYMYPLLGWTENDIYKIVLSIWILHVGFNFSAYCLSYFVYTSKHPFLEQYRILNKPWPWESNPKEWSRIFKASVKSFFFNQCLVTPLLLLGDLKLEGGPFFSVSTTEFPSIIEIILQCSFCMFVDDFFFYWGHRLLHHPKLYPHIHKVHHQWNHTVLISNEHSHPLEYIIANLPAALGPKLLGKSMHITTLWMWIIMRVGESLDSHCGYEFSWSPYRLLPLSGSSTFHDFHHSMNVGNYGSYFTIWDTICQTNKHYFAWLSRREKDAALKAVRSQIADMKSKSKNDPAVEQARINETRMDHQTPSPAKKVN